MNLLLVALPDIMLAEAEEELRQAFPHLEIHSLGLDLCAEEAPKQVFDWTRENGFDVNILLNNAGLGDAGIFENIPWEKTLAIIQLNVQASVGMVYHFLPLMKERKRGIIMGTSSIAGILKTPYKTTYSASKQFLQSFYRTLREECKGSGVQINVLCPPVTATNKDILKRLEIQGKKAGWITYTAEEVAAEAMKNVFKDKPVIVPGKMIKLLIKVSWLMPSGFRVWLMGKLCESDALRYTEHDSSVISTYQAPQSL